MIAALLASGAHAGASPCSTVSWPVPRGPVQAWLWEGQLGLAQAACPKTTVGIGPRVSLLVDTPAFYGRVAASGTLEARLALSERTAVGMTMEALRYESVISALSSSWVGYGSTTLTATTRVDEGRSLALAMAGRLVLPTAIGLYGQAHPVGGDVGLAFDAGGGAWSAHGQVGVAALASIGIGPTALATGLPVTLGATWQLRPGFALALDTQSSFAFEAPVDHVAIAPAVRLGSGRYGMELGAAVPVAGEDRTLLAARFGFAAAL